MEEKIIFHGQVKINTAGQVFKNTYGEWREVLVSPVSGTYRSLTMKVAGRYRHFAVGRLVARAFIPNPENKPLVRHEDGNNQNDAVENLRWITRSEMNSLSKRPRRSWKRVYYRQQSLPKGGCK